MENQASSKSVILNYGFYFGVITILISVVKYAMDMQYEQEMYSGIAGFVAMVAIAILAIKKFKTDKGGLIKFGTAVKVGIGSLMVGVLISLIYYTLFIFLVETDFVNKTMEAQRTVYEDFGMTESQIEQSIEQGKKYFFLSFYGGAFIVNLFFSAVVALIAAAIMKKTEE